MVNMSSTTGALIFASWSVCLVVGSGQSGRSLQCGGLGGTGATVVPERDEALVQTMSVLAKSPAGEVEESAKLPAPVEGNASQNLSLAESLAETVIPSAEAGNASGIADLALSSKLTAIADLITPKKGTVFQQEAMQKSGAEALVYLREAVVAASRAEAADAIIVVVCAGAALLGVAIVLSLWNMKDSSPSSSVMSMRGPRGSSVATPNDGSMSFRPSLRDVPHGRSNPKPTHFCPDLVVPELCECILAIPLRSIPLSGIEITDLRGNVVLEVLPLLGGHDCRMSLESCERPSTVTSHRGFMLRTASSEILARCFTSADRYGEFHLHTGTGDRFATLIRSENEERYMVRPVHGGVLHFWGNFENRVVNVTDHAGQLLATTERTTVEFDRDGEFYCLRVAPRTDVGLVVCSLLCIDHLGDGSATCTT